MDSGNRLPKGDVMQLGSLNGPEDELRVGAWIDGNGNPVESHFTWLIWVMGI